MAIHQNERSDAEFKENESLVQLLKKMAVITFDVLLVAFCQLVTLQEEIK